MKERIGLIDIGSNTIRLVVFQIEDNLAIKEIQNIKIPARIFQYLNDDKVMSQKGINVLCRILENFANEAAILKVDRLLPRATAAIRQSKNCVDILHQVKERTGVTIELVSGDKEAFYGFNAIVHSMSDREGVTIDIGGGSSEITLFRDKKLIASHSFPFGTVTLQENFFQGVEHNDEKAIKKARKFVREYFETEGFMKDLYLPIIGIGGSARNIARIHQMTYDYTIAGLHSYQMKAEEIHEVLEIFLNLSLKELEKLDGLSSDRADIIVPATLVFEELINFVGAPIFKFSHRGLREGIIYEYVTEKYPNAFDINHVATQTVERLTDTFGFSMADSAQRMKISRDIYNAINEAGYLEYNEQQLEFLDFGSYLYMVGAIIESGSASQHTFYMLSNSNLNGFNHKDRVTLSIIASYKNKTLYKQYLEPFEDWFNSEEKNFMQTAGGLIKFSEALNDSHYNIVKNIDIVTKNNYIILRIFYQGELISEKYRAESQKKHIERAIGHDIIIEFINAHSYDEIS